MESYDVAIIGGGGAGLTAALYTSRANLATVLFEKMVPGGQIAVTDEVENYPGFPDGILGPEIAQRMEAQAKKYGTRIFYQDVQKMEKVKGGFRVNTAKGEFFSKAVILASGASFRMLGVPGEKEKTGKGVSYCATCDGAFFKGKEVAVVGGGDSALQEGIFLTRFATKVTIVHRRDQLRASPILQERAKKNDKIAFIWDTVVEKVQGQTRVESLVLKNKKTGKTENFKTDGLFIFIGHSPNSAFLKGFVALDAEQYVGVSENLETSLPGVFAAGEIRAGAVRQLVAACGDGCKAALAVQHYLENL